MILYFCRSNTVASHAVRLITWSDWSHVGVCPGEGTVIEARWPKVREISTEAFRLDNDIVEAVEFPCADRAKSISWLRAQIGKPYDLLALLGIVLHRDWHKAGRWFCSELAAAALEQGGSPLFRAGVLDHVFPEHIWMINPK